MAKSVPAARLVCIELNPGPTPRGRGTNVPEEKRWQVVFYSKDMKLGPAAVARKVGVNRHTVSAIMDKYKKTRSVHDVKGRGKKRKLSDSEIKRVVSKAKKHKTAPQIARELGEKVCSRELGSFCRMDIERILQQKR